ncbi:uncharacterized protein L969DRAFT_89263 [Mixia osmundae IAM 14324]|uniref:RAM signaling network component n=1 Tax=Mixia osmundae (strain CBS 9802 / IAM 14324 / JCM 22182 / KY 12970) TaxID=764103 RepID=G7DSC8_MIXOS|nr:uncharacterized protein L969DRAFT_89263 [Mixia osmundae IAM 14324]KEI38016.1 hypothetical protein L969DRAFT_89263 [Mixia osmundae IAM 14324]GAA93488.1 hypothetical protein E5Q_00129 [Mixia osmundae IAM 14324]
MASNGVAAFESAYAARQAPRGYAAPVKVQHSASSSMSSTAETIDTPIDYQALQPPSEYGLTIKQTDEQAQYLDDTHRQLDSGANTPQAYPTRPYGGDSERTFAYPRPQASDNTLLIAGRARNLSLNDGDQTPTMVGSGPAASLQALQRQAIGLINESESEAPPTTASALLAHVLSLRKPAAQPMTPQMGRSHSAGVAVNGASKETVNDLAPRSLAMGSSMEQASHSRNISAISGTSAQSIDEDNERRARPALPRDRAKPVTGLETVDLSHSRIAEVPAEVIDVLEGTVQRLALGYNYLTALPACFVSLGTSLRYLNVRVNMLSVFPAVLCEMPSLEILDVSRNRIRKLPSNCGSLRHLKVFSISKNKIKRLPAYFAEMSQLRVLKCDHNPIEWPPAEITEIPNTSSNSDASRPTTSEAVKLDEAETMQKWLAALQSWIRDHAFEARPLSASGMANPYGHSRSDSSLSGQMLPPSSYHTRNTSPRRPGHQASGSVGYPAPPHSARSTDNASADHARFSHGRNASQSIADAHERGRPSLQSKKSLPDLRQDHAQIIDDRSMGKLNGSAHDYERERRNGHPPDLASMLREDPHARAGEPSTQRKVRHDRDGNDHLAGDRSSGIYFRRLSMLPPSSISKEVSPALLAAMDSVRGLLFALSQVYSAIRQFIVFAAHDKMPGAMSKIMATADSSMSSLINALDRFDSASRRAPPGVLLLIEVFQACQANVTAFRTLVSALAVQSKVLTSAADVRYTRTLLLMLYGATGEVSQSWQALTPFARQINVQLQQTARPPNIRKGSTGHHEIDELGEQATRPALRNRRHAGSFNVGDVRQGGTLPMSSAMPPGTTLSGLPSSAIAEDPAEAVIGHSRGQPLATPSTSSGALRDIFSHLNDMPPTPVTSHPPQTYFQSPSSFGPPPRGMSSRSGSQHELNTPESKSAAMRAPQSGGPMSIDEDFLNMVDATTAIAHTVCDMLLRTLGEEESQRPQRRVTELMTMCKSGHEATRRLRASLDVVRNPDDGYASSKWRFVVISAGSSESIKIWEDCNVFVKTVISIASLARTTSQEQPFPRNVREGLGQLAKTTSELATLLHVSSFKERRQEMRSPHAVRQDS